MKSLFMRFLILALLLLIGAFGFSACVDIDEALPHYRAVDDPGSK
jgi:hypothetical protein